MREAFRALYAAFRDRFFIGWMAMRAQANLENDTSNSQVDTDPWNARFAALNVRLNEMERRLDTLGEKAAAAADQSRRSDIAIQALVARDSPAAMVRAEIDRLDGYLVYHVERIIVALERQASTSPRTLDVAGPHTAEPDGQNAKLRE